MNIMINGKQQSFSGQLTLKDVINQMNMDQKKIVFLLNGQMCKDNPQLKDGDRVDMITFAGGG